jgi:DNA-binding NtrC family response regulator
MIINHETMKQKILLIDDDQDLLRSLQVILESKGYEVLTTEDAKIGRSLIDSEKPDLLVLDVMMKSDLEGYYLMQKLKKEKEHHELPIIMLTGMKDQLGVNLYSAVEDESLFPNVHFQDKPIDAQSFLELIKEMLDG